VGVIGALVRKHPLIAFFSLAYLLTWWIYPLLKFSPLLGFFGLFGPALAAIIMAAVTEGKSGVKGLLSRVVLWRVGLPWYVVALGLPTVLSMVTAGLYFLFGESELVQIVAVTPIELVLFVLVVGEELGWRGYALPLLLEERSPVTASLILGVLWGSWHLPTFLVPGTPQYGLPLTGVRLVNHRVFDLDDLALSAHSRQRAACYFVPWRDQPLARHLLGRHRGCQPVLGAQHRLRRCGGHCGYCDGLGFATKARNRDCIGAKQRPVSDMEVMIDYFLINFPEPLIS
jgi:membrane protease YdiL (CAAX protease family)